MLQPSVAPVPGRKYLHHDFVSACFSADPNVSRLVEQSLGSLRAQNKAALGAWSFFWLKKAPRSSSLSDAKPRLFLCSFKLVSLLNEVFVCAWESAGKEVWMGL